MKKILLLFILNMPFGINAQISTNNTTNSGQHSSAIGISTLADDYATTAMGGGTKAYGIYSTAMGRGTEALGFYSTTMGRGTISNGYGSLAIGLYNSSGSNYGVNGGSYYPSATAFVIGNGADENSRSDALVVKFNGDTTLAGSMTATSFIGEGSQISNLSFSNINNPPASFGNYPSFPGVQTETNQATGPRSFAAGHTNTSSGDYSTTFGSANTASGSVSVAMGLGTTASGYSSTAIGATTTASGNYSTAMGYETTASGSSSTATGKGTIASGNYSTAMGYNTEAIGIISTTMGARTIASDYSSLVVGEYNLAGSNPYDTVNIFNIDRPAFVIGNGTGLDSRSDALVVKFNGDGNLAGSMTATSFIGDGSQLTNLPFSYNSNEAGGIEIADYTTASGSNAFAVGNDNLASGGSSTAMGRGTIAGGDDSTAMGANTEASGIASTAMGEETIASGNRSTAMGQNTIAGGYASTAMGYETTASGNYSTAMGSHTTASGNYSTAMGEETIASGNRSTAMGANTEASDYASTVIGQYNLLGSTVTNSATDFSLDNTVFVIGNGTGLDSRSDALVVKFNGDATLAGNLNINSDARLKANIVSLGATLSKLLQIDGKSYTMKKDESEKQKIGLLAQDIEKVFPELVSESNGIKSVNYQGLVPVLINALKEQQAEIDRLKTQEERLDRLERLVAAMD